MSKKKAMACFDEGKEKMMATHFWFRKNLRVLIAIIALFSCLSSFSQTLSGTITDKNARPIAGASVVLLNTNFGAVTDSDGRFEIRASPGSYTMLVSAVGYASRTTEITIPGREANFQLQAISQQLESVTISAQKVDEALQRVPISVTALSSQQVQDYRIWNSNHLTGIAPNLYSADPGDGRNVTAVRGIATTSYDPAIATYVDGVIQFNLDTYIAQLYDIERVEVLRGPQGTLYGRNAMGGVVNIITKQPTNHPDVLAEVSVGNYNQQRYVAAARTPLLPNKLYAGVAGMFQKRDGFYTNEFNQSSFDDQQTVSGNYYLKFVPGSRTSVTLNVKHHHNRNDGPFPLVFGVDEAFNNPYKLNQNAASRMVDDILNASLSVQHYGTHNFQSHTSWQSNRRFYKQPLDGDFSPIDGVTIINNYGGEWNKVKVFTQEFKVSSHTTSKVRWTTGLFGFYQHNPVKQATRFGEDAALVGAPDKNFSIITTSKGRNFGVAAYADLLYGITSRLSLIAGIRYDFERKRLSVLGEYQKDPDPNPVFETRPDTSTSANFSAVSPRLGFRYDLSEQSNVFVTYTRGYRAGGLTQLSSDPSQPPLYSFRPEYSNNFEIGAKSFVPNKRVRWQAALFYTSVNDAQIPTLILPEAITVTTNAGELTSKGIELEAVALPTSGFRIEYAFGYTHARYKDLKVSQGGAIVDLSNNRQIFTPEITSMLASQLNVPLGSKGMQIVLRGEWRYLGEQYFDLANTIRQPGYSIFNGRVGFETKQLSVLFWSYNLGDKKYIAYAYDFGAIHLGDPRTYGFTIAARL